MKKIDKHIHSSGMIFMIVLLLVPPGFANQTEQEKFDILALGKDHQELGSFGKITEITREYHSIQTATEKEELRGAFNGSGGNTNILGVIARDAAILYNVSSENITIRKTADIPSEKINITDYVTILPFFDLSGTLEICNDNYDNNGDGLLDCSDPACISFENANIYDITGVPFSFFCEQTKEASVFVNNTGCTTWTKNNLYDLAALNESTSFVPGDIQLGDSDAVLPGQQKAFFFNMTAPNVQRAYLTGWQMEHDISLFGNYANKTVTVSPTGEICDDGQDNDCDTFRDCNDTNDCNNFQGSQYLGDTIPAFIFCNGSTQASITFRNTGCLPWTPGYVLRFLNDSSQFFFGTNVSLSTTVEPGQNVTFNLTMGTPADIGFYALGFRLHDGSQDFGSFITLPIEVRGSCNVSEIVITNPQTGETVDGLVNITFENNINYTPQIIIYGVNEDPHNWTSPDTWYNELWNTSLVPDGLYTIQVRDWVDEFGHFVYSNLVVVLVRREIGTGMFDETPPVNLTVWDDGNWTNNQASLHARWYSFDRESKVFYKYQIYDQDDQTCIYPSNVNNATCYDFDLNSTHWTDAPFNGLGEEVTITNGTFNGTHNITLELDEGHNYTFRVVALNSFYLYNLSTGYATSDGIVADFTGPDNDLNIRSSHSPDTWNTQSRNGTVFFEWDQPDDNLGADPSSGIRGYSFTLTTDENETPDYIADGDSNDLINKINHTYQDLGDGRYYFRVRAEDNARNWGNYDTYIVRIDVTPPGPPQISKSDFPNNNTPTLLLNWTASQDGAGSGIDHYIVEISYANGTVIRNDTTTNDNHFVTLNNLPSADLHFTIYAEDKVGWVSEPSDVLLGLIDLIPPEILFIKPNGIIVSNQPKVEVHTSEAANCTLNTGSGNLNFTFTNSAIHVKRILITTLATLIIRCEDRVRNEVTASVGVNPQPGITLTDFDFTPPQQFFVGQNVVINLTTTPSVGELPRESFKVKVDNTTLNDLIVRDLSQGVYQLEFSGPIIENTYNVTLIVKDIEKNTTLTMTNLSFGVNFNQILTNDQGDNLIYGVFNNVTVGIASDSSNVQHDQDSVSSTVVDGYTYLFVTKPDADPSERERFLKRDEFDSLFNPSFGYQIQREGFLINTEVEYDDIMIKGKERLPGGKYNLIIKNKGIDPTTGKTIIEIEIV